MKYVWTVLNDSDSILVHEGKPCVFLTRDEARDYKRLHKLEGRVYKLANVAFPKRQSVATAPKTYVVIVLDKSGSMLSMKQQAISLFNEQVQTIKQTAKEQDVSVIFVPFNEHVETKIWNKEVETLKLLEEKDYEPNGYTALYDAMGLTIDRMERELTDLKDPNTAVLFVVVTDGMENSSKEYSSLLNGAAKIKEKVERLTATKRWTFTYLGGTADFLETARTLGIQVNNTMYFDPNAQGMKDGTLITSRGTSAYMASRAVGQTQTGNFYSTNDKTTGSDPLKENSKTIADASRK